MAPLNTRERVLAIGLYLVWISAGLLFFVVREALK